MSPQDLPRLDVFGDALPSQALSRCGTLRFWHPPEKDSFTPALESVCFSPDSRRVVAASGSTARVWALEDGREVALLSGHHGPVNAVLYVSGSRIVTASDDRTVRLWDAENGAELRQWSLEGLVATCLAVSPDGRTLLVGTRGPDFAVIDLGTGELVRWVGAEGSVGAVEVIAFSPDGTRAVTVERTFEPTRLCVFDAATWVLQWSAEGYLEGDPAWVSFSRDGQRVIFPTTNENFSGLLRTYDARTGVLQEEARGYGRPVFLSDGTVARVSFRQIEILRDGKVERTVDIQSTGLCGTWDLVISPDERWATFAWGPSPLLLIELSTGKILPTNAHRGEVWQLTFSRDGEHLLTVSQDGTMRTWEYASGRHVAQVTLEDVDERELHLSKGRVLRQMGRSFLQDVLAGSEVELEEGCAPQESLWSTDGALFAHVDSHFGARCVHVHDARTGKLRRIHPLATGDVRALSRSGRWLVTAEQSREQGVPRVDLRMWNLERGTPCFEGTLARGWTQPMFSPDDTWLAVVEGTHTLVLLHLSRPESPVRFESPTHISVFAFSEDGRLVATGDREGRVRVWSMTGELLGTMEGHRATVTALAFSADGTLLASGSADTTVLLWPEHAWTSEAR